MKYLLLIYGDEKALGEAEREACYEESGRVARDLEARGQYVASSPLQPTKTALSVRVRDGKTVVTDGPFAETREQLGGYFLIDVEGMDEAVRVAASLPPVRSGTVEVRPVVELPPGLLPDAPGAE